MARQSGAKKYFIARKGPKVYMPDPISVDDQSITPLSLQKLYANVFGEKISKTQQLSNWEAPSLTQAQKLYAATDAWACIRLYEELKRLQHEGFEIISEEG